MKKVLVITYYWPPAGGPGVQRWLNFVKYLGDFGIEPVVYVPENPNYPLLDETFLANIPKNLKIYRKSIFEPYRFARLFSKKKTQRISSGIIQSKNQSFIEKLMLWIRGNFFIPDARKYWVRPSVKFIKGILKDEQIDTIITTGPPHSVHLIGNQLKADTNVKWIADFRDPWTSIGYHKKLKLTYFAKKKHKRLERRILHNADSIVVTSKTTKKEFQQITNKTIAVITNGYEGGCTKDVALDKKFTISHIGSMLSDRNPINLWRALSELIKENVDFKNILQLQFIGVLSKEVILALNDFGLTDYTNIIGYVSHEKALAYQKASQILLLVEIDSEETVGIIPGKLFEYMAAQRPILGIGPKNWEVSQMVAETNSGLVYTHEAKNQLKNVILEWFENFQTGGLMVNSKDIEQYSRKELTRKLAAYL